MSAGNVQGARGGVRRITLSWTMGISRSVHVRYVRPTLGHVRAQTPNASRRDAGTRKLTDLFDERPVLLPEQVPAVVSFARRILRAAEVEVYMPSQLR